MQFSSLLGHAAQLYRIIRKSPQPSDAVATEYFRSKKYIGSKERRFLSEAVFATLRSSALCEYMAQQANMILPDSYTGPQENTPQEIFIIAACCIAGPHLQFWQPDKLLHPAFGNGDAQSLLNEALSIRMNMGEYARSWHQAALAALDQLLQNMRQWCAQTEDTQNIPADFSICCCLPEWIIRDLLDSGMKPADILLLGHTVLHSAPLCLRINTLASSREHVLNLLAQDGINARSGSIAPDCIILNERIQLQNQPLYQNGIIEVQDEGSQLISMAAGTRPGMTVLDYCAGAGGKTLHLAALQKDEGQIIATDIEFARLKEVYHRASRAGIHSIRVIPMKAAAQNSGRKQDSLDSFLNLCDAVLVDAPCTGMGTIRRMPMVKWRLTQRIVDKICEKQKDILQRASEYVKPDGILIYATCSLLPAENQQIIDWFLQENPHFEPAALSQAFTPAITKATGIGDNDFMLPLLPHIHGTDGFFMARMRRNE
jgi:16S rRNA (cytosine967-C5)-methyltransferase